MRTRSPKYDGLVDNLRDYLENEINRCLNRFVFLYRPAEIVVERLDFTSPGLSRRMNRLLSNFGKKQVKKKLLALSEEFKIEIKITEVNPAYTSQECSECGYIDKKNRKNTRLFVGRCCNKKIDANVNGARNIRDRSSEEDISAGITLSTNKEQVLRILTCQFLSGLERCSQRLDRKAEGLLSDNPYFGGYSPQSKGIYNGQRDI